VLGRLLSCADHLAQVNTFPLDSKVESLAELSDAVVLCAMLGWCCTGNPFVLPLLRYTNTNFDISAEDIDPHYAVNDLEKPDGPSKWLNKKKCLEAVYRSLLRYIRNHTLELDSLTLETTVDFDAIAEHDDVQETIKVATYFPIDSLLPKFESNWTNICTQLLTIFLMAAVNGPEKEKYIGNILNLLDESAQFEIMDLIKRVPRYLYGLAVC
jgi:protein HOOK3